MKRIIEIITNIFMIPELRRRILFTLGVLIVWRFGIFVPLPGVNMKAFRDLMAELVANFGAVTGYIRFFTGGGGGNLQLSVFSLGIMPYITASIMFSLLIKVVPRLEALAKEGPSGYRKISQYTRYATVPICIFWGVSASIVLIKNNLALNPGFSFIFTSVLCFTAGSMFVMWLGEQITEYGIGNGASLIIMSGIIDGIPAAIMEINKSIDADTLTPDKPLILLLLYLGSIAAIVYITQAQRRIPVQYSKHIRGRHVYGGQRHYLPLRINHAGVMPVIFASTLMMVPYTIGNIAGSTWLGKVFDMSQSGFWYTLLYIVFIFFFSYFWNNLYFRPVEMSDMLKESGSFVPGIRPGHDTALYLQNVMNRITLVEGACLTAIILMPTLSAAALGVSSYVAGFLGGTGILIIVGVGLDIMQKVESHLLMREYDGFMKKGRIKGRR
ncbi:MAG: preprotein translocase subunit SecY [Planctomycetota bacterium]